MPLDMESRPYVEKAYGKRVAPEEDGWQKELIFKGIFGKETFYEKVRGQPTKLKRFEAFVYREYRVKAGVCRHCKNAIDSNQIEDSMCRIKKMSIKTGLYRRCFLGSLHGKTGRAQDFTDQLSNWDDPTYFKLLKEEPIAPQQVFEKFKKGELDYIADFGLLRDIEAKMSLTF
jgi:hypothetical protein